MKLRKRGTCARCASGTTPMLLIALLSSSMGVRSIQAQSAQLTVRAENPLQIERPDETITIPWATVRQRLPNAQPGVVRVLDGITRQEVAAQAVDEKGDGSTDDLIFQASFTPGETKAFVVQAVAPTAKPAERVYVRHIDERDDVAWENDRIGYRIYGQGLWKIEPLVSSGIDVWVKRVRYPIIDKWYSKGHDSYHRDTGEGADFYDVGTSLGDGGDAVWRNGKMYPAKNFKSYRIIANGPVRAIFELQYDPWDAGGMQVSETRRFAIDAGQNLFREESVFRTASAADIPYVIGVFKRKGLVGLESKAAPWAWLTGWGPVSHKDGGHGDLGTAVMLERSRVSDWKETDDHYLAVSHAASGQPVVHYIGAGWTDSGDFRDVHDWWAYLDQFAQRLGAPIKVTLASGAP